ncbi:hypothetical protein L9F63_009056, partial [Diploptera punctata]
MREIVHLQAGQCGNQIGAKKISISYQPGCQPCVTAPLPPDGNLDQFNLDPPGLDLPDCSGQRHKFSMTYFPLKVQTPSAQSDSGKHLHLHDLSRDRLRTMVLWIPCNKSL